MKQFGNTLFLILIFAVFVLTAMPTRACEPCEKFMSLDDVVERADVILIGNRQDPPWFFNDNHSGEGPPKIKVKVNRVLKGVIEKDTIIVDSWSGMCAYGITLYKEKNVLMLLKASANSNQNPKSYMAVDFCGPKQFKIIDGYLTKETMRGTQKIDERVMALEEFEARYLD